MASYVHLVGSIGLDTVDEVFNTAGRLLGQRLKRMPDGEPGGRRMWTSWQYPVLRTNSYLQVDASRPPVSVTGFPLLKIADGVKPQDITFGELGYAREARASYLDFVSARSRGLFARNVRFQVCFPTPWAVIARMVVPEALDALIAPYEKAMLREVETVCANIPHADLAIQWDVCFEMLVWDGRWAPMHPFPGMERSFGEQFARLSNVVPHDVELGFHLCYGDLDGKHFVEPDDSSKMVELANLIAKSVKRPIAYVHMPVPVQRDDDAYFAPLKNLKLPAGTELYLGLVHAKDGAEGTKRRMAAARKVVKEFGIAAECGIARGRSPALVREFLEVHAAASS